MCTYLKFYTHTHFTTSPQRCQENKVVMWNIAKILSFWISIKPKILSYFWVLHTHSHWHDTSKLSPIYQTPKCLTTAGKNCYLAGWTWKHETMTSPLGTYNKIRMIQGRLAWLLWKHNMHKLRNNCERMTCINQETMTNWSTYFPKH